TISNPITSHTLFLPCQSTPFPYTTLFDLIASSTRPPGLSRRGGAVGKPARSDARRRFGRSPRRHLRRGRRHSCVLPRPYRRGHRSEEHTSELQSREKLVCRLLLEKK